MSVGAPLVSKRSATSSLNKLLPFFSESSTQGIVGITSPYSGIVVKFTYLNETSSNCGSIFPGIYPYANNKATSQFISSAVFSPISSSMSVITPEL
jgi:hypothetical protein